MKGEREEPSGAGGASPGRSGSVVGVNLYSPSIERAPVQSLDGSVHVLFRIEATNPAQQKQGVRGTLTPRELAGEMPPKMLFLHLDVCNFERKAGLLYTFHVDDHVCLPTFHVDNSTDIFRGLASSRRGIAYIEKITDRLHQVREQ